MILGPGPGAVRWTRCRLQLYNQPARGLGWGVSHFALRSRLKGLPRREQHHERARRIDRGKRASGKWLAGWSSSRSPPSAAGSEPQARNSSYTPPQQRISQWLVPHNSAPTTTPLLRRTNSPPSAQASSHSHYLWVSVPLFYLVRHLGVGCVVEQVY